MTSSGLSSGNSWTKEIAIALQLTAPAIPSHTVVKVAIGMARTEASHLIVNSLNNPIHIGTRHHWSGPYAHNCFTLFLVWAGAALKFPDRSGFGRRRTTLARPALG